MLPYWSEFIPLMLVFLLALISPGADFILVVRQAVVYGRKAAFATILGIASGLVCHVSYSILGLGLIISQSIFLFNVIKWAGVTYLIFIGCKALTSKGTHALSPSQNLTVRQAARQSIRKAFLSGLAVNLLNPKAMLFFLSIFSNLVAPTTPNFLQFGYGFVLIAIAIFWFTGISLVMTTAPVARVFSRLSQWIDRISGLIFIAFGVRLMFQKIS